MQKVIAVFFAILMACLVSAQEIRVTGFDQRTFMVPGGTSVENLWLGFSTRTDLFVLGYDTLKPTVELDQYLCAPLGSKVFSMQPGISGVYHDAVIGQVGFATFFRSDVGNLHFRMPFYTYFGTKNGAATFQTPRARLFYDATKRLSFGMEALFIQNAASQTFSLGPMVQAHIQPNVTASLSYLAPNQGVVRQTRFVLGFSF